MRIVGLACLPGLARVPGDPAGALSFLKLSAAHVAAWCWNISPGLLAGVLLTLGWVFSSCDFGGSLEKGRSTMCTVHPSCLWKSCRFPAVLNWEYWRLTFKLLLRKLQASWKGSEWEGKWRATYLHINVWYALLYYIKAWFCMCLHSSSKGETQSLETLKRSIWL